MALLVIVVAVALLFDFTNGFHDTANVVASVISTRAISPRRAVALASGLNFAGALLSLKVAATIATGILATGQMTETVIFAGLTGAIGWNLLTWAAGLPSSSSHALIGGLIGALLAAVGGGGIHWLGVLDKVVIPALIAPLAAFAIAAAAIGLVYRAVGGRRPGGVNRTFRGGELLSGSALALAHGTNDAQKTMGVIGVALLAHDGGHHRFGVPLWVVLASAATMGLGTYAGGWRIIRTVGSRIIRMDPAQGFCAQVAGAVTILLSSALGYPLSSTHVISGAIAGAGAGKRTSAVRWGVASTIVLGWVLTVPAAGCLAALLYGVTVLCGSGILGPLLVLLLAVSGGAAALGATRRRGRLRPAAAPV
ncbi:MAG TPA: inorganic phosphate transporter [Solirubrobacteraceae bacterium]|nr:inorganic phosphate transporter [Solirubrobacteraceae bacterium]